MISQYESCILRGIGTNLDGEGLGAGFFEFRRVSDHEIGVLRIGVALHDYERGYLGKESLLLYLQVPGLVRELS